MVGKQGGVESGQSLCIPFSQHFSNKAMEGNCMLPILRKAPNNNAFSTQNMQNGPQFEIQ